MAEIGTDFPSADGNKSCFKNREDEDDAQFIKIGYLQKLSDAMADSINNLQL